jgi:hypothetical protein
MRRTITWLVIANVCSLIGSAASAEIISLYPVSERSAWDRTTVGSNGIYDGLYDGWYDGTGIGVLAFHGVIDYEIRGAMEFDIRPVSAEATVRSALLFVTTDPGHGDVPLIQLYVEGYAGNGTVELGDMAASN